MTKGLELYDLKVPSYPNHSGILCLADSPKDLSAQTHFAVCPVNIDFFVLFVVLAGFINGLVKQVLLPLPLPVVNLPCSTERKMSLCGTKDFP